VLLGLADGVHLAGDGGIGQELLDLGGVITQLLQGDLLVGADDELVGQLAEAGGQAAAPESGQCHGDQNDETGTQQQVPDRDVAKQCGHERPRTPVDSAFNSSQKGRILVC
jgi:hypothetical protein